MTKGAAQRPKETGKNYLFNIEMMVITKQGEATKEQMTAVMAAMETLSSVGINIKIIATPKKN